MKALIVSDIHFHPWTLFASTDKRGMNTRLSIVIEELHRAVRVAKAEGCSTMIISGDVFHARGSLDPEVLNPVRDAFEEILQEGFNVYIIPGNHDLKSDDTKRLSSAVQNLEQIDISGAQVVVFNEATAQHVEGGTFGFVPWRKNTEGLLADLKVLSERNDAAQMHVFIHAGIDGVLSGIPGHGLTAADLASFGFKGVYAGHYHNHADMSAGLPGRVMSIGATTHHNWGDVNTKAGFLILDTDANEVVFHDTKAPKFVDVSGMSETDMEIEAAGNYVRFRGPQMTQEQVNEFRDALKKWGALGVSIEVPRTVPNVRATAPATGLTLDQSVGKFVDEMKDVPPDVSKAAVSKRALEVLSETRAVSVEA
ncbi:metallophosphoesterase [Phaeobacter gallaeciensis]|uniref:metallophosphoesterase n=1 Tax=Phaeobacter gallaeciensis TaxID=60890 RepID=UPI0023803E53|nr:metallophosphoesterase [Phaeobacter gallaeciensis]MDE4297042.1 metallophosphoesterase [Phaeobacter gallaeciensis]